MKFSLSWLKEHLETRADAATIADALVALGHEVDDVIDMAARYNGVVVGHVKAREKHPDADKLGVCKVDLGKGDDVQIVCGAPNARAGISVAVATVGAVLPGDFAIKKAKIRGVESNGMICSLKELGMGEEHNGIWEMETDAKPGTPLSDALGLNDVVFEVSVTPNRGDGLSIHGLARDLAAAGIGEVKGTQENTPGQTDIKIKSHTESENCPFFSGIEVRGIKNSESPSWLQKRLEEAGLRPRNTVVDITNYLMLSYGQPLHAYDADKVKGSIRAVDTKGGETYTGIGDVKITLNTNDVAIVDDSGVIGLGGILGGESTAVSDQTENVFIEAAWFKRSRIARTGQDQQILSDARYRFERGIDPEMTAHTGAAAANLIQQICGGTISVQTLDGSPAQNRETILFNPEMVKTFGGLTIENTRCAEILATLGFNVADDEVAWRVIPPSWRTYMTTPEDLVEEILRVEGYDAVPSVLPPLNPKPLDGAAPDYTLDRATRRQLAANGAMEVISYSFINQLQAETFADGADLRILDNPLDADTMATLRPSLLPGLLDARSHNLARSEDVSPLYEVGRVFANGTEALHAAAVMGERDPHHWREKAYKPDVYDAKAQALQLLELAGVNLDGVQIASPGPDYYHPGRSGVLKQGKTVFGTFGEIHPEALKSFDLKGSVAAFEVHLSALSSIKQKNKAFKLSPYQPVTRDLAFIVDADLPAGDLLRTVKNAAKELLRDIRLFDAYSGDKLPKGRKSLALSLTLQADDRTLSDKEINAITEKAVAAAQKHLKAELRDG